MKTSIVINGHPLTDDQVTAVTKTLKTALNQVQFPEAYGKALNFLKPHKESLREVTQMCDIESLKILNSSLYGEVKTPYNELEMDLYMKRKMP